MQKLAEMFKALSDETRVRIMAMLLLQGELCVCDVEGALGITQSKSSRHLRYLLHADLVENRRQGTWMHYRLPVEPLESQKLLLEALQKMFSRQDLEELESRLSAWFERKGRGLQKCEAS